MSAQDENKIEDGKTTVEGKIQSLPENKVETPKSVSADEDASTKEIIIYAFGNIENASANQFFGILQQIMVVAMNINPLLIGFALSIKTFWDSITDPIMAYISDNTKSRWGRRHPYILMGGVIRIAMLLFVISFFPVTQMRTNKELDIQKQDETVLAAAQKILKVLDSEEENAKKVSEISAEIKEIRKSQDDEKIKLKLAAIEDAVSSMEVNPASKEIAKNAVEALLNIIKDNKVLHLAEIESRDLSFAAAARYASVERINDQQEEDFRKSLEQELKNLLLLSKSRDLVFFMGKSEDFIQAKNLAKNVVSDMLAKKDMAPVNVANAILEKLSEHMETVNARGETRKKVEAIYQIAFKTVESGSDNKEALKNISKLSDELNSNLSKWQAPPEILNAAENISKIVKNTNPSMQAIIENSKIILGVMEQKKKNQTALANLIDGLKAFSEPDNAHQRSVVLYFLLVILLFTTFTTMNSVPYYALGIELCPSYDGRTKVVVWRSIMDNIAGIVGPWIPVFCFSLFFENALQGLWWVALFTACIGIPSTIIMVMFTKERGHISAQKRKGAMEMGLFKSIWITLDNIHFIKIVLLYSSIGLVIGLFTQIGFYLNVYWVMKSAVGGAKLGAWVGMVAWGLGLITLPVINWGCKRFQKHTMMAIAMSIMSVGCILKWWCMNPKYPYLQLILPFFFSIGIASTYTVLATMMSDVTDVDELRTGQRREGMFGAVNAFILKLVGTITPALAGAILVLSGFDPDLGFEQKASTILNMRILYSFVPGILTLFCLLLLYRYPLTREKVMEIKKQLKERREAAASVAPATTE